jgi:translation elongation factor P/translation initiation factor 5A
MVRDDAPFQVFYEKILKKFNVSKLKVSYKDSDGDMIVMMNDNDLEDAIEASQNRQLTVYCSQ